MNLDDHTYAEVEAEMNETDLDETCDCSTQQEIETYINDPIYVDGLNVSGEMIDCHEFRRGIADASYICGIYSALTSCGMSLEFAQQYIINKMSVDLSVDMNNINANASIECSKNQAIMVDKNQL